MVWPMTETGVTFVSIRPIYRNDELLWDYTSKQGRDYDQTDFQNEKIADGVHL